MDKIIIHGDANLKPVEYLGFGEWSVRWNAKPEVREDEKGTTVDWVYDEVRLDHQPTVEEIQEIVQDGDSTSTQLQMVRFAKATINTMTLSSKKALSMKSLFPIWGKEDAEFGKEVEVGFRLRVVKEDSDTLYEVIQKHTLSEEWEPGLDTASLYKVVEIEHTGTQEDPIPYTPPMEIFKDKYYTQNDILYKCTRDSEIALSHDLSALVGTYVELA